MALVIIITQKPQIPWFFNFLPRKVVFVVSNLPSLCPESHWLWHRPPIFRGLLVIRWNGLAQWWCVFKWPAGPPLFARLELQVHQHLSPTIVLIFYQKIEVVKLSWVDFNQQHLLPNIFQGIWIYLIYQGCFFTHKFTNMWYHSHRLSRNHHQRSAQSLMHCRTPPSSSSCHITPLLLPNPQFMAITARLRLNVKQIVWWHTLVTLFGSKTRDFAPKI